MSLGSAPAIVCARCREAVARGQEQGKAAADAKADDPDFAGAYSPAGPARCAAASISTNVLPCQAR